MPILGPLFRRGARRQMTPGLPSLVTMHGTIMVFFRSDHGSAGRVRNYFLLSIGAEAMAFPLSHASFG